MGQGRGPQPASTRRQDAVSVVKRLKGSDASPPRHAEGRGERRPVGRGGRPLVAQHPLGAAAFQHLARQPSHLVGSLCKLSVALPPPLAGASESPSPFRNFAVDHKLRQLKPPLVEVRLVLRPSARRLSRAKAA